MGNIHWAQILIGVLTVFTGGGAIQLMMFAFKHKKEMKALDRSSAAQLLTSSSEFAAQLQADAAAMRAELTKAKADILQLQQDKMNVERSFIAQLNRANEENSRLQGIVVQLQTDLNIARGQIRRLENALQSYQR